MASVVNTSVKFTGDASNLNKVAAEAAAKVRAQLREIRNSNRGIRNSVALQWDDIQKRSPVAAAAGAASRGMAIPAMVAAGVAVVGSKLATLTGTIDEAVRAMRTGSRAQFQVNQSLAASIPIFGNFIRAGMNIREIITGTEALWEMTQKRDAAQESGFGLDLSLGQFNARRRGDYGAAAKMGMEQQHQAQIKQLESQRVADYQAAGVNPDDIESAKREAAETMTHLPNRRSLEALPLWREKFARAEASNKAERDYKQQLDELGKSYDVSKGVLSGGRHTSVILDSIDRNTRSRGGVE